MNYGVLYWYGGKSAKGFSAKYFQRIENSETKLSEKIFELRVRVQSVDEGEMYFRYCAFRAFFSLKESFAQILFAESTPYLLF
jgi:hypothetical protein